MPNIILQSSDGKNFQVDVEVAKCSVTIKDMLENLGGEVTENEVLPLPNVNAPILKMIIEWATHHKEHPLPTSVDDDEIKEKRTDDISQWDVEFLKIDQDTLFELVLAANYLDVKGLLDLTCKTVANMIKGRTPDEIRKTFNIEKNWSPTKEQDNKK